MEWNLRFESETSSFYPIKKKSWLHQLLRSFFLPIQVNPNYDSHKFNQKFTNFLVFFSNFWPFCFWRFRWFFFQLTDSPPCRGVGGPSVPHLLDVVLGPSGFPWTRKIGRPPNLRDVCSARHLEVGNGEKYGIFRRMIGRSKWDSIFFGQNEIEVDQNELKKIQVVSSRCLSCRLCIRRVMHYRFQNHQHLTLVTRHLDIQACFVAYLSFYTDKTSPRNIIEIGKAWSFYHQDSSSPLLCSFRAQAVGFVEGALFLQTLQDWKNPPKNALVGMYEKL